MSCKLTTIQNSQPDFLTYQHNAMTPPQEQQKKARFFGMHIGQEVDVFKSGAVVCHGMMLGIAIMNGHVVIDAAPNRRYSDANFDIKLILRPLSDISDEEAVECAKIALDDSLVSIDNSSICRSNGATWVVTKSKERFFIFNDFKDDCMFLADDGEEDDIRFKVFEVADFLRSRNFCLPFQGIDPIDAGWAILEAQKQNSK